MQDDITKEDKMNPNTILTDAQSAADRSYGRRAEIRRLIDELNREMDDMPETSVADGLKTIADAVAERLPGTEVGVFGPQGVDCLMSIRVCDRRDGGPVASLTFRPSEVCGYRLVDYTRNTGLYDRNSVGAAAGMNYPDVPVPESIEEIVEMLQSDMQRRAA